MEFGMSYLRVISDIRFICHQMKSVRRWCKMNGNLVKPDLLKIRLYIYALFILQVVVCTRRFRFPDLLLQLFQDLRDDRCIFVYK